MVRQEMNFKSFLPIKKKKRNALQVEIYYEGQVQTIYL